MDLPTLTHPLRAKVAEHSGLNAILKFDCGADGVAVIDGRATPNTADNINRDADCTVALATPADLISGELEPTAGFMMGKFKVSGRNVGGAQSAARHLR